MAYFDEKQKQIVLSPEDREMFNEVNHNVSNKKSPIADRIMKAVAPEIYQN